MPVFEKDCSSLKILVHHIATINPMVPHTLIGGKTFTTSYWLSFSNLYEIEFDKDKVGMKKHIPTNKIQKKEVGSSVFANKKSVIPYKICSIP